MSIQSALAAPPVNAGRGAAQLPEGSTIFERGPPQTPPSAVSWPEDSGGTRSPQGGVAGSSSLAGGHLIPSWIDICGAVFALESWVFLLVGVEYPAEYSQASPSRRAL